MKTKAIVVVLLLMFIFIVPVYGEDTEAEQWEKVRQMEQLAERFKAETGFTGESINIDNSGRIKSVTGTFQGISVPVIPDTLVIRQAFTSIRNRITPFVDAPIEQLQNNRVYRVGNFWTSSFEQVINGYKVHNGRLSITYSLQRRTFNVANSTIIIPYSTLVSKLSYEDALGIFNSNVDNAFKLNDVPLSRLFASNVYCDVNKYKDDENPEYRLCWLIGVEKTMAIDAITGEIYYNVFTELVHLSKPAKSEAVDASSDKDVKQ
ncbi:MAG: hypothetical protein CVU50_08880 [Candidatus Cloacimonetes bacterium HGW-Cloacimonetes-3]|jgi:hypothetical protein|nr:MAG: hypothetical protein CVU50_08880 [Candidatus Cloacimonetes bacterium HGW-Cloacimonetes-3]